jgi:phosphopantothenoylcysteine synthetase/decarboxylase
MNSIHIPNTIKPAKQYKIIIAATGSVAAIKLLELVKSLIGWADIKVVMTSNVFISP